MSWKYIFRGRTQPIATPDEEDALYAVMNAYEPVGEDESYHRLMGLIADDLRAQRWAVAPKRNWLPVASLTVTAGILAILAYSVGSWHGASIARENFETQIAHNAPVTPSQDTTNPLDSTDNTNIAPMPLDTGVAAPAVTPREEVLALVPNDNLNQDQKDTLSVVIRALDEEKWGDAAKNLLRLADSAPGSDIEIYVLHAVSELYANRLNDSDEALNVLLREHTVIVRQLETSQDSGRRAQLQSQKKLVEARIAELYLAHPNGAR